jgi:hypothetical protein
MANQLINIRLVLLYAFIGARESRRLDSFPRRKSYVWIRITIGRHRRISIIKSYVKLKWDIIKIEFIQLLFCACKLFLRICKNNLVQYKILWCFLGVNKNNNMICPDHRTNGLTSRSKDVMFFRICFSALWSDALKSKILSSKSMNKILIHQCPTVEGCKIIFDDIDTLNAHNRMEHSENRHSPAGVS